MEQMVHRMPSPLINLHVAQIDDLRLPATDAWLSIAEREELARFRAPHRRSQWLAGRWLGKQVINATADIISIDQISISTYCPVTRRGVAPRITVGAHRWLGALSIAHVDGWVAVAYLSTGRPIGIDIASRQALSIGFADCWFTPREQAALADQAAVAPLRYWVAKEALYKALGGGRSFRPQDYELHQVHDDRLSAVHAPDMELTEFEYSAGILTVAAPRGYRCSTEPFASGGKLTPLRSSLTKVYA